MRNSDPPLGRSSARKCGLILRRYGPKLRTNSRAGSCTTSRYRSLFLANQARSLCLRRSSRNVNISVVKSPSVIGGSLGHGATHLSEVEEVVASEHAEREVVALGSAFGVQPEPGPLGFRGARPKGEVIAAER